MGVYEGVTVGVFVGVSVGVSDDVSVGVAVGVSVGVSVGVINCATIPTLNAKALFAMPLSLMPALSREPSSACLTS